MPNSLLAILALFSVQLGFSALLGFWIYTAREKSNLRLQALPMLLYALLLGAANWTAPVSLFAKTSLAFFSLAVIWATAFRYRVLNIHPDWVWLYTAFSMAMIVLWSIVQRQAMLAISMSLLAFGACILALQRGNQKLYR